MPVHKTLDDLVKPDRIPEGSGAYRVTVDRKERYVVAKSQFKAFQSCGLAERVKQSELLKAYQAASNPPEPASEKPAEE